MPAPDDVICAALSYQGVKWVHQGRDQNGLDCLGLIVCVARDLGIAGADAFASLEQPAYGRLPPNRLAVEMARYLVRANGPAPGRIGLFAQSGTYPSHVGIFADGELIHAYAPFKKVVRHGLDRYWRDALRATFAYPGVR